jgi:hypothetical protein
MASKGNQIEKHIRNEDPSRRVMYRENEVTEEESSQDIMQSRRNNGCKIELLIHGFGT